MPRVFAYLVLVSVLTYSAHAKQLIRDEQIHQQLQNNSSSELSIREELFKKSLSNQRKDHAEAIKRLQKIDSYENLYKMLIIVGEKMIKVIETGKTIIENSDFNLNNRALPQNATVQSAISTILENTVLFGDIVLHFPNVMHRILKTQRNWNATINWSINFVNQREHFLDKNTIILIDLVKQELNITNRKTGYFNPYWSSSKPREKEDSKKKSKKEKLKRGPQITRFEL